MKTNFKFLFFLFVLFLVSCEEEPPTPSAEALDCNYFQTDRVLTHDPELEVDYIIDCVMDVSATITVEPGVIIQFLDGAGLYVRTGGAFNASGSATAPILLTAKNKVKGAWKGILFESASTQNNLVYTILEYAGGGTFNSNGDLGAVILWDGAKLNIDNSTISNSAAYGLNVSYRNSTFAITNSTITSGSQAPAFISPVYMSSLGITNDLTGNLENFVHVDLKDVDIDGDHTINNPSVPFRVFPYNSFQTNIRIIGGTTFFENTLVVEFEDGTGIYVDDAGTLKTSSELDQILFTGVNKTAGAWSGIYFQFTQGDNSLENLVIEYAGAEFDGGKGGVQMWGDPKLTLSDVDFSNIDGCAIVDRPKGVNDLENPNLNLSGVVYNNVSNGNYCKQ